MRTIRDEQHDTDPVTLQAKCIRASERAILVVIDGEQHWIPQSQVTDDSEVYAAGHEGKLVITGWFARKEGLGE